MNEDIEEIANLIQLYNNGDISRDEFIGIFNNMDKTDEAIFYILKEGDPSIFNKLDIHLGSNIVLYIYNANQNRFSPIKCLLYLVSIGMKLPFSIDSLLSRDNTLDEYQLLFNKGARITSENNDKIIKTLHDVETFSFLLDRGLKIPKTMIPYLVKKFKHDEAIINLITKPKKEEYASQLFNVYKGKDRFDNHHILKKCTPDIDIMSSYEYTDPDFDEDIYIVKDNTDHDTYRCYTLAEMKYMLDNGHKDMMRQIHVMSTNNNINNELWTDTRKLVEANFHQEENYCGYLNEITKNAKNKKKVLDCLNHATSGFSQRDSINWLLGTSNTPLNIKNLEKFIKNVRDNLYIRFDPINNLTIDEIITYVASSLLDYIVNSNHNKVIIMIGLDNSFNLISR